MSSVKHKSSGDAGGSAKKHQTIIMETKVAIMYFSCVHVYV